MRIVIDTNILVNALKSNDDAAKSVRLIEDVAMGVHEVCLSPDIIHEYADVLHRPALGIDPVNAEMIIGILIRHSRIIEPKPSTPDRFEMKDEDDRIFFDVARCENAKLITRNYKDYPVHELITPIDELY